jgi:Uma2 family endonuclease
MSWPELKPGEVYYPESDGKPMAETDLHRDLMVDLIQAAKYHFRDRPDVYVSGNLLMYFVEGEPSKSVAPDFFVVRGVPNGRRRTYKIWEEGKGPEIVIELTSRKTHREDLVTKRGIYDQIGVSEYILFDPEGIRFHPQLKGFLREGGELKPAAAEQRADGTLVLWSSILALELQASGSVLRLVDPETGQAILPVPGELAGALDGERSRAARAEQRATRAEQRATRAEQRAGEDRAELERLREEVRRLRDKSEG